MSSDRASMVQSQSGEVNLEKKFIDAKAYLQTVSSKSGINLYDHLAKLLTKVLNERPNDAADIIEDLSKQQKRERFVNQVDTLLDKPDKSTESKLADIQKGLFMKEDEEEEPLPDGDDVETPLPNLMELNYYFEQAGIGLGKEETFRIWLALKQLVDKYALETIRFWGKVFGSEQNYYIAEVQFQEGKDEEGEAEAEEEKAEEEQEEKDENEEEDPIPKPNYKPPPVIPREENGHGVNKFVYYVCNAPGKEWVRLPPCTPLQIQRSRSIKKFFTGRLNAPVVSYPPFEGTEAHYLRCQITRISAGTQISPLGFYRFDEEEDTGDDENAARESYVVNEEFEGIPARELADPTLANWVHHVQHVLPQGRSKWFNPKQKNEEEDIEEDEGEEDKEDPDEPEPEVGPPLLNPLSEDTEIDGQPAWTTKLTSSLVSQYAICIVKSNLWPGAYAFGVDKKFENVYIGWGHKYTTDNLNPSLPSQPLEEYPSGPEITEADDPSPQDEAQLRKAQEEADNPDDAGEEEEEEGEEEED